MWAAPEPRRRETPKQDLAVSDQEILCQVIEPVFYGGRTYKPGETFSVHPAILEGFGAKVKAHVNQVVNQGDAWFAPAPAPPGKLAPGEEESAPGVPLNGPLVVVRSLVAGALLGHWIPNEVGETREMNLRDAAKCIITGGAVIDTPLSDFDLAFARSVIRDPLVAY